jgi:decaprenylphospho-beta-D-ribofuranose 2-oxidase
MIPPIELCDIPHEQAVLSSFTELETSTSLVYVPRDQADLVRIFAWARGAGARITFRAGGHSFDDQSLPDDLDPDPPPHIVVSMTGFTRIDVDVKGRRMTVGPGATWGAIFARLQPLGFVPFVTVTTEHATAGGTLSGDCLSRFSPMYGKEGHHIVSFELMTVDGKVHACPRPPNRGPATTLGERLFYGAIGGLGYLGAVTSITYELRYVGETNGRIGVESHVFDYDTFQQLATELVPLVRSAAAKDPGAPESVFSALSAHGGKQKAIIIHSRYTISPDRNRMPCHEPYTALRLVTELLLRVPLLVGPAWSLFYTLLKEKTRYIDDLEGFTFMMDGTVRAKELVTSLGGKWKSIQQTFIVPAQSDVHAWETADQRLLDFLNACDARFQAAKVEATMMDVLFIPRDDNFLMSASNGMAGFAVSFAFETNSLARIAAITECFEELSDTCLAAGGRVYLVKNVRAPKATLQKMYEPRLAEFQALKAEVDPGRVLYNAFLQRNFG